MRKFLAVILAAMIFIPAFAAQAAMVRLPSFIALDRQNIRLSSNGTFYWCEDDDEGMGYFYAEKYAQLLQRRGDFRLIDRHTDDYDNEYWLFKYTGTQNIESDNWGEGWCNVEIDADEDTVTFYFSDGIEMED